MPRTTACASVGLVPKSPTTTNCNLPSCWSGCLCSEPVLDGVLERPNLVPVPVRRPEEAADALDRIRGLRPEEVRLRAVQEHAEVDRFQPGQVGAVLDQAVIALDGFHGLSPSIGPK